MMPVSSDRLTILFNSHPFHAFPMNGYNHCWELGASFDITLIVEEDNVGSPAVQALLANGRVKDLWVMPSRHHAWRFQRWAAREVPRRLRVLKPDVIMQAHFHYIDEKYIIRYARSICPDAALIIYLGVQHLTKVSFRESEEELILSRVRSIKSKIPFVPFFMVRILHDMRGWYFRIKNYYVIPFVMSGETFTPTYDPYLGGIVSKDVEGLYDAIACYTPDERQAYAEVVPSIERIHLVKHPTISSPDAWQSLYPTIVPSNSIAVLPSRCANYDVPDINAEIDRLSVLWKDCLTKIRHRTGGGKILWKLHPNSSSDPIMLGVSDRLCAEIPDFVHLPVHHRAEEIILSSSVVVGDVSVVLIWSAQIGRHPVISLDVFGIAGGDEMTTIDGISVVTSPEQLDDISFGDNLKDSKFPSLSEFVADFIAAKAAKADRQP